MKHIENGNAKKFLDLTKNGIPGKEFSAYFDQISREIRSDFAEFIGKLFSGPGYKLDVWLESPTTRNPVFSELFGQFVSLLALQRMIDEGKLPGKIKVDSQAMVTTTQRLFLDRGYSTKIYCHPLLQRMFSRMRRTISPFRSISRVVCEWLVTRLSRPQNWEERLSDNSLILIDTFIIPGFVNSDRYYPGLYENSGDLQSSIRFVPQFLNFSISELHRVVQTLRKKTDTYLLKEDWLSAADMFWCFGHYFRGNPPLPQKVEFRGVDVRELICVEFQKRQSFRCAVRGLMNFQFAKSLNRSGVRIRKTIDWFENHPMDRGWNSGFNTFYPDSIRVGYTGFYPAGQSFRPTLYEYNAGILPQRHLILGEGFSVDFREFFPECKIEFAPALRYQNLPDIDACNPEPNLILVAMPYYTSNCEYIISILKILQQRHESWQFLIKSHPAQPVVGMHGANEILSSNAELTDRAIDHWLPRISLMITGTQASSIIESVACAVPTILIKSPGVSTEVSIPDAVPGAIYKICDNADSAEKSIGDFLNQEAHKNFDLKQMAKSFREKCITPVNSETLNKMLSA